MICRLCNSASVEVHFDFGPQPIAHHLTRTPTTPARYPFKVGYCHACGFQQLVDHILPSMLYGGDYFTVSAWKPAPHAGRVIDLMAALFGPENSDAIFEIGCNDGSFLELLRGRGYQNLSGIEPTADGHAAATSKGFAVERGFFTADVSGPGQKARIIVARHVLEHVPDLMAFLAAVKDRLAPGGGLIIEVPDHAMNYEMLDYSFWEEHVNYFTINTLQTALAMAGLEVIHHETTLFSGKALMVYARHSQRPVRGVPTNRDHESEMRFWLSYDRFHDAMWWYVFDGPITPDPSVILYGAGGRAASLCNLLGLSEFISAVVDDQPGKQGLYLPGFKTPIVGPDQLIDGANVLLGVNTECETRLIAMRGLRNVASILPPSPYLPQFWRDMIRAAA